MLDGNKASARKFLVFIRTEKITATGIQSLNFYKMIDAVRFKANRTFLESEHKAKKPVIKDHIMRAKSGDEVR